MTEAIQTADENQQALKSSTRSGQPFKLGFFTQARGASDESPEDVYARLTDAIVAADELGYDSVWVGQHHFEGDWGRLPSPLVFLASVAAKTKHIELGTAISVLPFEDPIRLAEDASVLDVLANGRLNLGLGGGSADAKTFQAFGLTLATRRDAFDRNLKILHRALDGLSVPDRNSERILQPYSPGLRERLWHSVGSSERARKAARAGDNLLIGSFHDHALHDQLPQVNAYLEEWKIAGHSRKPRIGALRFVYWDENKKLIEKLVDDSLPIFQQKIGAEFPHLAQMDAPTYLEQVTRYGTPDEVLTSLQNDPALLGQVTEIIPTFSLYPAAGETTLGHELDIDRLEFFARQIAPKLGWYSQR